jgi:hypothetical protein
VPNFVDVATGGYGATIADALNGGQTPTLANFGTLANVLAGCATRVQADACARVFAAATPPVGGARVDRALSIASTGKAVRASRRVDLLDDKHMTLAAQPQRAPDRGATHAGRDEPPPTRLWPPGAGADALRDAAATTTAIEPLTPEEVRQMERERRSGFAQRVHVPPPSRR